MEEIPQPQEGMNPEPVEVEETTNAEETFEIPAEEVFEETVPKSQFNQVLARAKKAEEQLKKSVQQPKVNQPNALSEEQVEIKILKAQGRSEDEIKYLNKLAKVNGTSLIEAQSDELFTTFQKKRDDEAKASKAKLGASRGSGQVRKEKDLNTPGLSEAEFREIWKQKTGR